MSNHLKWNTYVSTLSSIKENKLAWYPYTKKMLKALPRPIVYLFANEFLLENKGNLPGLSQPKFCIGLVWKSYVKTNKTFQGPSSQILYWFGVRLLLENTENLPGPLEQILYWFGMKFSLANKEHFPGPPQPNFSSILHEILSREKTSWAFPANVCIDLAWNLS